MTEPKWTIETVTLQHPKDRFFEDEPPGIPHDVIRAIVRGRMADGRAFYWESWVTQSLYDAVGGAKVVELVRAGAHPPEEAE